MADLGGLYIYIKIYIMQKSSMSIMSFIHDFHIARDFHVIIVVPARADCCAQRYGATARRCLPCIMEEVLRQVFQKALRKTTVS